MTRRWRRRRTVPPTGAEPLFLSTWTHVPHYRREVCGSFTMPAVSRRVSGKKDAGRWALASAASRSTALSRASCLRSSRSSLDTMETWINIFRRRKIVMCQLIDITNKKYVLSVYVNITICKFQNFQRVILNYTERTERLTNSYSLIIPTIYIGRSKSAATSQRPVFPRPT